MMTNKPLVSIISPCYNSEHYIHRLLNSLLRQTYPNIEIIIINDGSTDRTEEIVLSFQKPFQEKGYSFRYFFQENSGQAAAINRGIKLFSGDYLTWPDSDDWLTPDSIEKRVAYLEKNKSVGILFSGVYIVDENDTYTPVKVVDVPNYNNQQSFFDCLIDNKGVFWAPIAYMVRSSMFIDSVSDGDIYESSEGQNIQMLLPVAYKYPTNHLDCVLGYYLERKASHSHLYRTKQEELLRVIELENIYIQTLNKICMDTNKRDYYCQRIHCRHAPIRFAFAYETGDKTIAKKEYKNLKKYSKVNKGTRLAYFEIRFPLLYKVISLLGIK